MINYLTQIPLMHIDAFLTVIALYQILTNACQPCFLAKIDGGLFCTFKVNLKDIAFYKKTHLNLRTKFYSYLKK